VSEFPPGEPARPHHFPRRNRLIAALSGAVVVVEAAARSGALITVDHALDLGLDIFAVPGSVESPQAAGSNALIRDGAHLLTCGEDLLSVMGWSSSRTPGGRMAPPASTLRGAAEGAPPAALELALGTAPRSLDQLVESLGLTAPVVMAALSRAEISGAVHRSAEGWVIGREFFSGSRK
jgi:DNA processing protein